MHIEKNPSELRRKLGSLYIVSFLYAIIVSTDTFDNKTGIWNLDSFRR